MRNRSISYASILIAIVVIAIGANAQTINLQLQADYTIGSASTTPARFAVGDVNNDGLPDLVTLNKNNLSSVGPISVFLNNASGGFGTRLDTPNVTLSPNSVVIRDFNQDGFADLAIAQDGLSEGVNIRLGNGTGNFLTGTPVTAERGSPAIVSADFNGDGHQDVADCNNLNELRVLNGNGAGGFGAATVLTTTGNCTDLLAADFNADGRPDIAVAERLANRIQVFLNAGSGFGTPINNLIAGAYLMVATDFNRDCIPDIAATQYTGNIVYILLGDGAGGFASNSLTITNSPAHLAVGDFNRDKKVDLAVRRNIIQPGANNLTILPGNGMGGFGAPFEQSIAVPTSSVEMRLATIDANLDGRDDLIIGRQGGFLLYHGNSPLFTRTEFDYDGDLKTDLSVFRPSVGNWYLQRTTQGFAAAHWGISADLPATADYDGDGKADIAVWRENGFGDPDRSYFFVLRSSTGTIQQEQFGRIGDLPVSGDWDGDGSADVAVYRNGAAAGDQSFFFYRPSSMPGSDFIAVSWGSNGDQAVRGDFDGDGHQDAAVFRPSDATWYILQSSNGQPRFDNWGLASDKRVAADYDGDGRTDLAVFRPSNNIWYIRNSSNGSASYRLWGASGDLPTPGDYNGDGRSDVAVYRPSDQRWHVPQCATYMGVDQKFGTTGDVAVQAVP